MESELWGDRREEEKTKVLSSGHADERQSGGSTFRKNIGST